MIVLTPLLLDLTHGVLAGVAVPDPGDPALVARLHPVEQDHAAGLAPRRRAMWVAGRVALRAALAHLGLDPGPLLHTARGAPALPPGVAGSVSHTGHLAVALAARDPGSTLGVDVEAERPARLDVARRVLSPAEQEVVDRLPGPARWAAVLLRFSIKEAAFKALDRVAPCRLDFTEVSAWPDPGGRVRLEAPAGAALGLDVRHHRLADAVLCTARRGPERSA